MKPKVYSFLGGLSGLGSTREERPPSGENFSPKGDDEAERITRLDAERNARDKAIGRGTDYAPIVRDAEIDRIARTDGWQPRAEPPPGVVAEIKRVEASAKALGWDHDPAMELRILAREVRSAPRHVRARSRRQRYPVLTTEALRSEPIACSTATAVPINW
jgi:hypothetical protein